MTAMTLDAGAAVAIVPAPSPPRPLATTDDTFAPGARIGSWRVEAELGRGGMASVQAVVHAKLGKRAAIKIAHRDLIGDGFSAPTFLREARVVRRICHPAVIDVFATGESGGRPYLVMERLAGTTLGNRLDSGPPIPRATALGYLIELCDVLRAAHDAGVVHRDIKLDNVFLCSRPFDDGRRVKLLDWGVAHVADEDDPFRGLIAGTITYVAPEQVRGEPLSPAADTYSLGVLAFHLLCRRAPFMSSNQLTMLRLHARVEPPRPSTAWPDIPPALDDLVMRMLAKQPEQRPSLDDVERCLRACRAELTRCPDETPVWFAASAGRERPAARITPVLPPVRWLVVGACVAGAALLLGAMT